MGGRIFSSRKSTLTYRNFMRNISTPDLLFSVQFNTMAVSAVCGAKLIAIPIRPVINAARIENILFIQKIINREYIILAQVRL